MAVRTVRASRAGILATVLAVLAGAAGELLATQPLPVDELAPGVFVHQGRHQPWAATDADDVANLGFVVGSDCVAVIDTGGSPATGAALLASIRAATTRPVCYVINTHVHPDHILGNPAFAALEPRPRFVAHARLPASLAARAPFYLHALGRDTGATAGAPAFPAYEILVDDSLTLELGDVRLHLRAWQTAHTDNDLSVHVPERGVVFLGDLLFSTHLPVIDGRLLGWLAVMDALSGPNGGLAGHLVVPGHGHPTSEWARAFARQHEYLALVRDRTRQAIAEGRGIAETVEALAGTGIEGWLLADDFHRRNLTAAFAELEWED
ncbi:hypothetical protein B447_18974 [Thauera sp. 27]|uniref:quinoprotein relay system zinc metallohydrolase 2 n=1 Tax=Thauera sp. 27 TaxID=305700 RepID=UPI0002CE6DFE|nr:quinoprotein relay system zinc metallohydrolase 2 [Thauera sp. 27]ENO75806.1 hypothetical protein B447_18974 [Thauera sp. 27]